MARMTSTPQSILKSIFGYDEFKPLQREIIENVLARRDTLVIMPTGGGKSLCYQIPALIFEGLTVVISPLIALMKDQVEQLRELGVPALFLNSSLSLDEYRANVEQVRSGKARLVYVAPETLLTERFMNLINSVRVDCLAIDEAHCISEWGHDFRPEYRQIASVRAKFPQAACLALTATATPRVREDIKASLRFDTANEFVASFDRDNLLIEVLPKTDSLKQLLDFLNRYPQQSGIIYCFSRKGVDDLTAALAARKFSVRSYHAGLDDEARRKNQEAFIRDDVQIIVATIAFGMGINKPNVRFVVHFDLPKSVEGYYQEIGRAGRDGLTSHCLLLYSYSDVAKLRYFIDQKDGLERQVAYHHLGELVRYAEGPGCRRVPLLKYFGEQYGRENCGMCDRCLNGDLEEVDVTVPAQKLLSCVKRTGEIFGMVYVVDVLLGSENQKVLRNGHQNLSTYGIGKELTRGQWMNLARQLVQKGLLDQDSQHGSLRLTRLAGDALRNREPIFAVLAEAEGRSRSQSEKKAANALVGAEYDRDLFEVLRSKRKELADLAGVPPYAIFPDRTLVEMAAYYPMRDESLGKIFGVGTVKRERYGEMFLEAIRAYCAHKGLSEKSKTPTRRTRVSADEEPSLRKPRHVEVGEAYNAGQGIQDLMTTYAVQVGTILDHLAKYVIEGRPLRAGEDLRALSRLNVRQQDAVMQAFAAEGPDLLKPVFDRLNGAVSYDELKVLRVLYLALTQA